MTRSKYALAVSALLLASSGVSGGTEGTEGAKGAKGADAVHLHMIHTMRKSITQGSDSFGVFTPAGPQLGTLQPAPRSVDYIAFDAGSGTYYGQKTSTVGTIESGKLTALELPPSVDLSHSGGLAFDADRASILVASTSGAGMVVWEFAPGDGSWNEIGNFGREQLKGLACDGSQGTIFTLEKSREVEGCATLHVHNRAGARVLSQPLSTPIPLYSSLHGRVQLAFENGALYALTSHHEHPRVANTLHRIDPATGQVHREPYNASVDLTSKTWPGWQDGPPPSPPMMANGARGRGVYSTYRTPESLVSGQPSELHVIVAGSGSVDYLQWLKKVKKFGASTNGETISVEIEIDTETPVQPPVVEVAVGTTEKPVTLVLVSGMPVTWSIDVDDDANLAKIINFDAPYGSGSPVLGVGDDVVADGGHADASYAWELARTSTALRFDEMIAHLRTVTGLRENTFQGLESAEAFSVGAAGGAGVTSADR
ncbi:MAG: hypothetical protein GY715_10480 [Planctomycetes bacterium]|nr:hypothetical protein [Planctomycetota bacterium]